MIDTLGFLWTPNREGHLPDSNTLTQRRRPGLVQRDVLFPCFLDPILRYLGNTFALFPEGGSTCSFGRDFSITHLPGFAVLRIQTSIFHVLKL